MFNLRKFSNNMFNFSNNSVCKMNKHTKYINNCLISVNNIFFIFIIFNIYIISILLFIKIKYFPKSNISKFTIFNWFS